MRGCDSVRRLVAGFYKYRLESLLLKLYHSITSRSHCHFSTQSHIITTFPNLQSLNLKMKSVIYLLPFIGVAFAAALPQPQVSAAGAACGRGLQCEIGLICTNMDTDAGTCAVDPKQHVCFSDDKCDEGYKCYPQVKPWNPGMCRPIQQDDQQQICFNDSQCDDGFHCSPVVKAWNPGFCVANN